MLGDLGFYFRETKLPAVLSPLQRVLLIGLVVAAHAILLLPQWESTPSSPVESTVSASLILADTPTPAVPEHPPEHPPIHHIAPSPHPVATEPDATPAMPPAPQAAAAPATLPQVAAMPAPTTQLSSNTPVATPPPDREPDYRAAYLNNPAPMYPKMATNMGWQGKVVVNVEVLTTGLAGQVTLQHSSGHEVLDNAALQAVRTWRFLPARQNGQLVSKHFLIPIPFTLKDRDE